MSESLSQLKGKFIKSRPGFESNIGGQCLQKALNLHDRQNGGELYWVGNLDNIGLDFGLHHTYFVPLDSNDSDIALNQADNGFPQYPALTVGEVKLIGENLDIKITKEIVRAGRR